ncbi:PH domain-containing protein [Candidatus Dependentiae bacterium]|nr:PH domain-containing protein [Candidatus Dependentiae bacterium]
MDDIRLKPDPVIKNVWYVAVVIFSFLILVMFILPSAFVSGWVFLMFFVSLVFCVILTVIWIQYFFKTLKYEIDFESVKSQKGVFWKKSTTIPFRQITNVDITQGPVEGFFDISHVHVQTAGAGGQQGVRAEIVMLGLKSPLEIKETIMTRIKESKLGLHVVKESSVSTGVKKDNKVLKDILNELKEVKKLLEKP